MAFDIHLMINDKSRDHGLVQTDLHMGAFDGIKLTGRQCNTFQVSYVFLTPRMIL